VHGTVRVLRVAGLATRRGPPAEAQRLYVDIGAADGSSGGVSPADVNDMSSTSCIVAESSAYRAP